MTVSLNDDRIVLISDPERCHADIQAFIESPLPGFFGRIGGSDTDVVLDFFYLRQTRNAQEALAGVEDQFHMVRRFNGYYDKKNSSENMLKYCELLIDCYQACGSMMMVGPNWISEFLPTSVNPVFLRDTSKVRDKLRDFIFSIGERQMPAKIYPYSYTEKLLEGANTLFRAFSATLPGKRVLVITPFEQSIRANFYRRNEFFPNFKFPEFELLTYNTPVTYEGLPSEFYPDGDWFETLDRMKREIGSIDFDIALLACGSYAMPLGLHVRDTLARKAIYVGGCLQLFFGIMGRRYDNPFFLNQINAPAFIWPIERDRFLSHANIGSQYPKEAFGAYF